MNGHIVKDKVDHTISCDSKPCPSHDAVSGIKASIDRSRSCGTEEQRENVIQLKAPLLREMMRLMNSPERAMHDVLMESPAKGFHACKGQYC